MIRSPSILRLPSLSLPVFTRLNALLNQEVGQHPGIFTFMNRLRTFVFESGFTSILQTNAGRNEKCKVTLAAQALSKRAKEVEDSYKNRDTTATDLLRLVAVHYDDAALVELLNNLTDTEVTVDEEVQDMDLEIASQESQASQDSG